MDRAVSGVYQVGSVLEQVVDDLNDVSLAQHHLVIQWHKPVLHVGSQPRDDVRSVLKQELEELCRDVSPVTEQPPVNPLCQHVPHPHVTVVDVSTREHEGDDFAQIVAHEVQLEAVAPSHRALAVGCQAPEHLVGVAAQVVAHRYHRAAHERDACAGAEGPEIEEEHHVEEHAALQLHKAVIGHGSRELLCQMDLDEVHVEVLEVAECAKVVQQQDSHDLAVLHVCLAVAPAHAVTAQNRLF